MEIITTEYDSQTLGHATPYSVIIPDNAAGLREIPYITITHGMTDDVRSWIRGTRLPLLLEDKKIAAVMPFAANSYYTDMARGEMYWTQITEELPVMLHDKYKFSTKRAKRFLMGNSMGGYGAFKIALSHPDRYAAAVSFSGVTDIVYRFLDCGAWPSDGRTDFGRDYMDTLEGSEHDLYELVRRAEASGGQLPILRQLCGTEDFLHEDNIRFRDFMMSRGGWDYKYYESRGDHWWDFWDKNLPRVLDFFESLL